MGNRCKILHIAEPFATGVLSFLVDITNKQVEEYEVYIAYGIRPLTPPSVETLFDTRVHLIRMDCFKGALGTVVNPKAYSEVRKLYHRIRPDIVHLHSSASGFVGRWALPCVRNKVFYTPHGYSFLMQDGSRIKRWFYWLMEYLSAKCGAETIACSEGEYKEALKLSRNSTYVNNGINLSELDSLVPPQVILHSPLTVCTSGRILYQKNPSLFNQIALSLPSVRFIWIGEGELRSVLTAPNIEITGWVTRQKALEIVCESDIFLLTSLWEGLPISLLEAMFLKKLCMVSNVIGNRDVVHPGTNGFVCDSVEEYVDAINHVARGDADYAPMAERASEDVRCNYNAATMAGKYNEIYRQK